MGNISHLVIDSRLKALTDRHHSVEKIAGDVYLVHRAATYYPALDFWRMNDGSAQGYDQRGLIEAIDDAQLRGMIPEPAVTPPPPPKLGEVVNTEPMPIAIRDSAPEHGGGDLDPDSSVSPLNATELTQPRSAEISVGNSITGLPTVDWT